MRALLSYSGQLGGWYFLLLIANVPGATPLTFSATRLQGRIGPSRHHPRNSNPTHRSLPCSTAITAALYSRSACFIHSACWHRSSRAHIFRSHGWWCGLENERAFGRDIQHENRKAAHAFEVVGADRGVVKVASSRSVAVLEEVRLAVMVLCVHLDVRTLPRCVRCCSLRGLHHNVAEALQHYQSDAAQRRTAGDVSWR